VKAISLFVHEVRNDDVSRHMEPYSSFLTWRFDTASQFACGLIMTKLGWAPSPEGRRISYCVHLLHGA
jgi:hypothetical protein